MFNMVKVTEYACDKYYYVIYKRDYYEEYKVEGLLLNYASGNIVLLSEEGIYHIRYNDIVFMKPIKPPTNRLSKEFNDLLESFKKNEVGI